MKLIMPYLRLLQTGTDCIEATQQVSTREILIVKGKKRPQLAAIVQVFCVEMMLYGSPLTWINIVLSTNFQLITFVLKV